MAVRMSKFCKFGLLLTAVLQDNLLQQFNELMRHLRGHERLHRHGDLFGVLTFRKRRGHDLIDELTAVLVLIGQHARPQFGIHVARRTAACTLNMLFLLVQSTNSASHLPRLYATHARYGSRRSQ